MLGQLANSMLGQSANILLLLTLWTVYVSLCIHALLLYCTTTVANWLVVYIRYVKTTVIKYFYPSSAVLCFAQNKTVGAPPAVFCERSRRFRLPEADPYFIILLTSQSQWLTISTASAFSDQESRATRRILNTSGRYQLLLVPTQYCPPRRFQWHPTYCSTFSMTSHLLF